MRIQDAYPSPEQSRVNAPADGRGAATSGAARGHAAGAARVTISALAQQKAAGAPPDVDHAKVARLRETVKSGGFDVDHRRLAAALLGRD